MQAKNSIFWAANYHLIVRMWNMEDHLHQIMEILDPQKGRVPSYETSEKVWVVSHGSDNTNKKIKGIFHTEEKASQEVDKLAKLLGIQVSSRGWHRGTPYIDVVVHKVK